MIFLTGSHFTLVFALFFVDAVFDCLLLLHCEFHQHQQRLRIRRGEDREGRELLHEDLGFYIGQGKRLFLVDNSQDLQWHYLPIIPRTTSSSRKSKWPLQRWTVIHGGAAVDA